LACVFRATPPRRPLERVYTTILKTERVRFQTHFHAARLGCLVSASHAPREVTIYADFAE
jgi:hypothetical protein